MENTQEQKKSFRMWPFVLLMKSTKLFKVVKMLKFTKILITFFSMALSVFVYAFMMGPWFSIGFVLMLFIHEMGHVMALRHKGYPASAPIFIPMFGAVIFSPAFNNAEEEAYIGYGGPFIGGLAALALFGVWAVLPTQYPLLLMISYIATFINLFNMIPIRPLDGGRVTRVVGSWFKWIGMAGLILLGAVIREPMILFIFILVLSDFDMKLDKKFYIGSTLLVIMTALMILGYSTQAVWVDVLDVCLAGLLVFVMFVVYRRDKRVRLSRGIKLEVKEEVSEPVASVAIRLKWFALYIVLLVGLIVLMVVQASYLPQHVK